MESHRIKTKIGVHEFEATGPEEIVNAQFNAWMAAVTAIPQVAAVPLVPPPASPAIHQVLPPPADPQSSVLTPALMERMFRQDDGLSLAALPSGDNATADAMLAILYGYMKLKNETTVTGTSLMKSARVSGVPLDRVDRIMGPMIPDLVLAAGVKKARRYQLNNRGIAKAEEVIKAVIQ